MYFAGEIKPLRLLQVAAVYSATAVFALLWLTGESSSQPVLESGPDVQVTADGLYPVDPSIMPAAWVRPGEDLSGYTRVFFMPTIVQFREGPDRQIEQRRFEGRTEFPVSEIMKPRVTELFGESFHAAISRARSLELSSELGRDVVMVQGFLTDVISGVPPNVAGSNVGTVRWALDANIVVELRDSMSNEILARTVDHQRIEGPFDADEVFSLVPQITRGWAGLLVTRIRELFALYPSRLRRLQDESER